MLHQHKCAIKYVSIIKLNTVKAISEEWQWLDNNNHKAKYVDFKLEIISTGLCASTKYKSNKR